MSSRVLIVDDHPMCREATRLAVLAVQPESRIETVATIVEAKSRAPGIDLMTLDLTLADRRGALSLPATLAEFPETPVLVITAASHPQIEKQVSASGAQGFLPKSATMAEMIDAIRAVLGGERWFTPEARSATLDDVPDFAALAQLTPAQRRIRHAMMDGKLNKQIAFEVGLSEITVKSHVKAILRKLEVPNRTQAILMLRNAEA